MIDTITPKDAAALAAATSKGYSETMDTWGDDPTEAMNNLIAAGHDALIMAGGDEIVIWDTSKIKIISKQ